MTSVTSTRWFDEALAQAPTEHDVEVEGTRIHYLAWGRPDLPGVVLVHGGLAHARWWEHIAPLLVGYRVVALDLSGHGDSAAREIHDLRQWGREIKAVIDDAGLLRPVVVGHSMGGTPAVAVGVDHPDEIRGVVTVDSRFNDYEWRARDKESATYASVDEAVEDFRPVHPVDGVSTPPYIHRRIAETSLRRVGDRWRWKRLDRFEVVPARLRELLPQLTVPLALVRTEFGVLTAAAAQEMKDLTPAPVLDGFIPGSAHNPMLEQPLALVEALQSVIPRLGSSVPGPPESR